MQCLIVMFIGIKKEAKIVSLGKDKMNKTANQCDEKYADIIDLPHHVSMRHPKMPLLDRAAQFGSYAALRGYDEAVTETVKKSIQQTEAYIEMEQYDD